MCTVDAKPWKEKRQRAWSLTRNTRVGAENESGLCPRRRIKAPLILHERWDGFCNLGCVTFALISNMLTVQDLERTVRREVQSCKMARVNKALLRVSCACVAQPWMDGQNFDYWLFCPICPYQILSGSCWDVNTGLSYFASYGRNNHSEKKIKNTSAFCCSVWSCGGQIQNDTKTKRQTKAGSENIKEGQNESISSQTKLEAFWNGEGRGTSQKFESENLYCYNAYLTICMKNYRRSEASLALTFAQGLYVKVKPQGRDITSTFTLPKIFYDGFYA